MAQSFNGTNQYVKIANDAAILCGSGDFSVAVCIKLDQNEGTSQRTIFANATYGTAPGFTLVLGEENEATFANKLRLYARDPVGDVDATPGAIDNVLFTSTSTPGTLRTWLHILLIRLGNTFTLYVNGTECCSTTNANFSTFDNAAGWWIGAPANLNADRMFLGSIGGVAKWNRALSETERLNQASGQSPLDIPDGLVWLSPQELTAGAWKRDADTGLFSALTVTNNGGGMVDGPAVAKCERRITGRKPGLLGMGA